MARSEEFSGVPRKGEVSQPRGQEFSPVAFLEFDIEVVSRRYSATETDLDVENDKLWKFAQKRESELIRAIQASASEFYGPEFTAEVTITRGSVEIMVLLLALATYRKHVENIQWFASHVRGVIKRILGGANLPAYSLDVSQTVDVARSPALADPSAGGGSQHSASGLTVSGRQLATLLIGSYFLFLAAFLGLLIWLVANAD
jgi:hypothetical protein